MRSCPAVHALHGDESQCLISGQNEEAPVPFAKVKHVPEEENQKLVAALTGVMVKFEESEDVRSSGSS